MIGHIEARNLLPAAAVLQALAPNTKLRLSVAKDYGDAAGAPPCWNPGKFHSEAAPQDFPRAAPLWMAAHAGCGQQCASLCLPAHAHTPPNRGATLQLDYQHNVFCHRSCGAAAPRHAVCVSGSLR